MRHLICLVVAVAVISAGALEEQWSEAWRHLWPSESDWFAAPECTVSRMKAYDMASKKEAIWFSTSPLDDPMAAHILPLNKSSGEQWEFDGVSADGLSSFVFGFYRDPNYAILGSGNLRCSLELTFANSTMYGQVDYASESSIESCPGGTRGTWKGPQFEYTFEVSHDMSVARVAIRSATLSGHFIIQSRTPPRYADASPWPSANASTAAAPFFHWFEPIPVGSINVALDVEGEAFAFDGMGGFNHFWTAFSWFTCLQSLEIIRAMVGPYSLSYQAWRSNIRPGVQYRSAFLAEDGVPLLSTTLVQLQPAPAGSDPDDDDQDDYVVVDKLYDAGGVSGALADRVTGWDVQLVSPRRGRNWVFSITHRALAVEFMLGRGSGGDMWSATAQGGHVGLRQHSGIALTEALTFPARSPLFRKQYHDEL